MEGKTTVYAYDLAGNLLSDSANTYTYDAQNRLLTKTGKEGTISYEYDAAGNLVKETSPDGTVSYTYNAQNKLVKGELSDGQSSTYTYNALGARIENVQVRENENRGYQNADLTDGSHGVDYLDFLKDGRAAWQRAWESEVGTVHQNDFETMTRHYTVDYLSAANRDLIATEDGSYVTRYVYDANSVRISAEFDYADGTQRGATNANGEYGENPQSDFATERGKVWYRWSHLGSTLFAVDASGEVVAHMVYDAWGNPLTETYPDTNFSGFENTNNYTGYTYDETLDLYFAQNRFYAADLHRFTQEDAVKDGANWYVYCGNNPVNSTDTWGLFCIKNTSSEKCGLSSELYKSLVTQAQKWLEEMKYLNMEGSPYGTYGGLTIGAVAHFQFNYGLEISGELDSETYLRIYNSYLRNVKKYEATRAMQLYNSERTRVMSIDRSLRTTDYYPVYDCNFVQNPKTINNIPVVEKNGKYYMDYTAMIDAVLLTHENEFKVMSIAEYYEEYGNILMRLIDGANGGEAYRDYVEGRLYWFATQVMNEGPWDLKLQGPWEAMFNGNPSYYAQKYPFIYRGEIINAEILGNITYGYLGASMGYTEKLLMDGAEFEAGGKKNDSLQDKEAVRKGMKYYENK